VESVRAWFQVQRKGGRGKLHRHHWLHGLPFKMRFQRSRLYISALTPLVLGFLVGILAAIMGVGGGFLMVPAMIYVIGMPTQVVVGTSLFQIAFVTAVTTFLHATNNHTVDIVLALSLIVGGVIGAQVGTSFGARLRGEQIRILLAMIVLAVCSKLGYDLIVTPDDLFSLGAAGH
ncbi:MAG: sulfite exporter TauE/SafE family protein, partial [Geminicoccaceae bacterium]